ATTVISTFPYTTLFRSHFAAAKGDNLTGRAFRVQLADGSVVTAPSLSVANEQVTLTLGQGNKRPVDLASIILIEQLNGPVSWLRSEEHTSELQSLAYLV